MCLWHILQVGASLNLGGQAQLDFVAYEKAGPYDVDFYTMTVPGLMTMELRMRIANPQLQSATDAEAHFNLAFAELRVSSTPQATRRRNDLHFAEHSDPWPLLPVISAFLSRSQVGPAF